MEAPERSLRTTYTCVVGHEISSGEIEHMTHVESLDGGARVRLCNEHGAPIAETVEPGGATAEVGHEPGRG